jgi:hypothetical protein
MKKLIIILLLSIFMISCNKHIAGTVYRKVYPNTQVDTAYADIYSKLKHYNVDSIPLNKWMLNNISTDTINIDQKILKKNINEKSLYIFVFTKYTYPSRTYYQFIIRYSGKEKDLIK